MPATTPPRPPAVSRGNRRVALRELLLNWAVTLPASGWCGTVSKLELSLYRVAALNSLPAVIPRGSGLARVLRQERATFAALRFSLTFSRTATTRTIRVTPES